MYSGSGKEMVEDRAEEEEKRQERINRLDSIGRLVFTKNESNSCVCVNRVC